MVTSKHLNSETRDTVEMDRKINQGQENNVEQKQAQETSITGTMEEKPEQVGKGN